MRWTISPDSRTTGDAGGREATAERREGQKRPEPTDGAERGGGAQQGATPPLDSPTNL